MSQLNYNIKELEDEDLENYEGFFETLGNLREVGNLSLSESKEILKKIKSQDGHIFVAITKNKIIGAATGLIEQKFIRKGAVCMHIEDVSTRKGFEGNGIATKLINKLIDFAKERGCYKIILDCEEKLLYFYSKSGFKQEDFHMRMDL